MAIVKRLNKQIIILPNHLKNCFFINDKKYSLFRKFYEKSLKRQWNYIFLHIIKVTKLLVRIRKQIDDFFKFIQNIFVIWNCQKLLYLHFHSVPDFW